MTRAPRRPRYSLMFIPEDDEAGMGVTAFDGDQPICSETIINLVDQWADLESSGGELMPIVDDTLNVLSDLTYAMLKVLERLPQDDPHRAALHEIYAMAYQYVQRLVDVVNADE